MTAAVPDPRFRDELAEALWRRVNDVFVGRGVFLPPSDVTHVAGFLVDQAMPAIAAEVEARVQAAELDWEVEAEKRLDALIAVRAERDALRARVNQQPGPCPTCIREGGPYRCCPHCVDDPEFHKAGVRNHHDLPCSDCVAAALASPAPTPHAEGSTDTHPASATRHEATR